ncbi:MAG: hypothetical protein LBK99_06515 [Opitutaceae bacterium]|nr:hypothetical protein [Opitutaceae bacterium]
MPGKHKVNADGTPFVNGKGRYMPIGGRPKKGGSRPDPVPAPAPGSAPGSAEPPVSPPMASFIPDVPPPPPPDGETGKTGLSVSGDAAAPGETDGNGAPGAVSSKTVAELVARTTYLTTGVVTGEHDEAQPPRDMHRNLCEVIDAQVDNGDGKSSIVGWGTLAVAAVAYLVHVCSQPRTRQKLHQWWKTDKTPKPVSPVPARTPVPAPVRQVATVPAAPVSPVPRPDADPFSDQHF